MDSSDGLDVGRERESQGDATVRCHQLRQGMLGEECVLVRTKGSPV